MLTQAQYKLLQMIPFSSSEEIQIYVYKIFSQDMSEDEALRILMEDPTPGDE